MTKIILSTYANMDKSTIMLAKELMKFWELTILVDTKQKLVIPWAKYVKLKNKWYDLGKLHQFIAKYPKYREWLNEIIYCNDTNILIKPLDSLFDWVWRLENKCFRWICDAYTEHISLESHYGYHLQSYFRWIRWEKNIEHLVKYYKSIENINTKEYAITMFELWLSKYMQDIW